MEELDVFIVDSAYPGKGVAKHEGKVIFVRGVMPAEQVRVRVVKDKKRYAEAEPLAVLVPSAKRQKPECPLADVCPGCSYQHATYAGELELKQYQFRNMLSHKAEVDLMVVADPFPSPEPLGYRNKMVLHIGSSKRGRPSVGYFGFDNETVIDVDCCPLAHSEINETLALIRIRPEVSRFRGGTIEFRFSPKSGIVWRLFDQKGRERGGVGSDVLIETTGLGDLEVPFGSFFQVNMQVADEVVQYVQSVIRNCNPEVLGDLYGGVGAFAIAAAQMGVPAVIGADTDGKAVATARTNAERLECGQVEVMKARAADAVSRILKGRDASNTMIIVDPPRRGLDDETFTALVKAGPRWIVYVSCAPDTLLRDIVRFQQASYGVKQARLFDMFARTASFETVTVLEHTV